MMTLLLDIHFIFKQKNQKQIRKKNIWIDNKNKKENLYLQKNFPWKVENNFNYKPEFPFVFNKQEEY